jgi:hypothetical protein
LAGKWPVGYDAIVVFVEAEGDIAPVGFDHFSKEVPVVSHNELGDISHRVVSTSFVVFAHGKFGLKV